MNLGIKGRRALVTGGSSGIGRAIALALATEGCHVAICARTKARVDQTKREIEQHGVESLGLRADVTKAADARQVVKTISTAWQQLDILVNNAGGGGERVNAPVELVPERTWLHALELNTLASIRFTKAVIPMMRRQHWGRVVTITSVLGFEGGGRPWYNLSRSAQISLMKTLALDPDLARAGLTFNSVALGAVKADGNDWDAFAREDPRKFALAADKRPLGRLGTPEEVAAVVAFVCSERASLLNGACIVVDGAESRSF